MTAGTPVAGQFTSRCSITAEELTGGGRISTEQRVPSRADAGHEDDGRPLANTIVPDAPLANKSFNLYHPGSDL